MNANFLLEFLDKGSAFVNNKSDSVKGETGWDLAWATHEEISQGSGKSMRANVSVQSVKSDQNSWCVVNQVTQCGKCCWSHL